MKVRHIGAPAVTQASMVPIWVVVRQERGMVLLVEQLSGMREVPHAVTGALMISLSRLVDGLPGTTRVWVRHAAATPVPTGMAFTRRVRSPVVLRRSTCGL